MSASIASLSGANSPSLFTTVATLLKASLATPAKAVATPTAKTDVVAAVAGANVWKLYRLSCASDSVSPAIARELAKQYL